MSEAYEPGKWYIEPSDHAECVYIESLDHSVAHHVRPEDAAEIVAAHNQRAPAPGAGDEATRAAAERLIGSCTDYIAEHGNPMLAPNLYTDAYTVARAVLAGDRAAEVIDRAARMLYRLGRKLDGQDGWYDPELRQEWVALVNELQPLRAALAEHEGAEAP